MQSKFIKHVIGLLLIILCTQLYAKKKMRYHDILLVNAGGSPISFTNFKFLSDGLYVSKGQPKGKVYVKVGIDADNNYYLRVHSGKHQTSAIADKFKQLVGGESHSLLGHYPEKLNFVVSGTLEMTMKKGNFSKPIYIKNFVIGHGHHYSNIPNKWWIGGVNCTASKIESKGKAYMTCKLSSDPALKMCIVRLTDDVADWSTLSFSLGECKK